MPEAKVTSPSDSPEWLEMENSSPSLLGCAAPALRVPLPTAGPVARTGSPGTMTTGLGTDTTPAPLLAGPGAARVPAAAAAVAAACRPLPSRCRDPGAACAAWDATRLVAPPPFTPGTLAPPLALPLPPQPPPVEFRPTLLVVVLKPLPPVPRWESRWEAGRGSKLKVCTPPSPLLVDTLPTLATSPTPRRSPRAGSPRALTPAPPSLTLPMYGDPLKSSLPYSPLLTSAAGCRVEVPPTPPPPPPSRCPTPAA